MLVGNLELSDNGLMNSAVRPDGWRGCLASLGHMPR